MRTWHINRELREQLFPLNQGDAAYVGGRFDAEEKHGVNDEGWRWKRRRDDPAGVLKGERWTGISGIVPSHAVVLGSLSFVLRIGSSSSVLRLLSSVLCLLSSVLGPRSSFLRPLFSVFRRPLTLSTPPPLTRKEFGALGEHALPTCPHPPLTTPPPRLSFMPLLPFPRARSRRVNLDVGRAFDPENRRHA